MGHSRTRFARLLNTTRTQLPECQRGRLWRRTARDSQWSVILNEQAGATPDDEVVFPAMSSEGPSCRFFVDPVVAAVRGGRVTGMQWDRGNRGSDSTAFGLDTTASAAASTALGLRSAAVGSNSMAFGVDCTASGVGGLALGTLALAQHDASFVWSSGAQTTASANPHEATFGCSGGFRVLGPGGLGPGSPYVPGQIYLDATETVVTGKLTVAGLIDPTGLECVAQPANPGTVAPTAGTYWVSDTTPTAPVFTDSLGVDHVLTTGGGAAQPVARVLVVASPAATGQFASITAAMASILDNSALIRYVISVGPGIYTEEDITIKSWVTVSGITAESVVVESFSDTVPVFRMSDFSVVQQLTLRTTGGVAPVPLLEMVDVTEVAVNSIHLSTSEWGIVVGPAVSSMLVRMTDITTDNAGMGDRAMEVDGSGIGQLDLELRTFDLHILAGTAIVVVGAGALVTLTGGELRGPGGGGGIGVVVQDGATVNIAGLTLVDLTTGITDAPGPGSVILLNAVEYVNVATSLSILNPLTTGLLESWLDLVTAQIDPAAPFFRTGGDNFTISVAQKGGDFDSLASAVAYINSLATPPSLAQSYLLVVGAGTFVEPAFTIPQFVQIQGVSPQETVVQPSSNAADFITADINTGLSNLAIVGPTGGTRCTVLFNGGPFAQVSAISGTFYMQNVQLRGAGAALIKVVTPAAWIASMSLRQLDLVGPFTTGLDVTNNGILTGFLAADWNHNNSSVLVAPRNIIRTAGTNIIQGFISNGVFSDNTAGGQVTALLADTGGSFTISNLFTDKLACSVAVSNSALTPVLRIRGCTFNTPTPASITVLNALTTGSISVVANSSSISILAPSPLQLFVQSPSTGETLFSGVLAQGDTLAAVTNVSAALQIGSTCGVLTGGALTTPGGLVAAVAAGTGYLTVAGALKYVAWGALSAALLADTSYYLWIDSSGALVTGPSAPSTLTTIVIGFARTQTASVAFFQQIGGQAAHTPQLLDASSRAAFGPIFESGCNASNGGGLTLNVTSGTYYYGTHAYTPSGASPISTIGYYGGGTVVPAFSVLSTPLQYDNAGTLTTLLITQFVKHAVYVVNDGATERYLFVFAQQTFASQVLAEAGALPIVPSFFTGNVAGVASVVVQGLGAGYLSIQDIRPRPAFVASAAAVTLDHQALSNRGSLVAHTQYLLKDGSDTMAGALQMGTNAITDAGLINGVTIEAHAARHLPGGADPLITAAPVTIAVVNAEGVAASFARSDHVHAHGAQTDPALHATVTTLLNGFMTAADKVKLNGATATPTPGQLVLYDGTGQLTGLGLVVSPSSAAPGAQNDLHLLSNDSSVVSLRAPDSLGVGYTMAMPPNMGPVGYVLARSGATGTIWVAPTAAAYTYYKVVEQLADFPAPVAGVISLVAGTTYLVTTNINLGANRISCSGGSVAIEGNGPLISSLTSSSALAMLTSNASLTIQYITLTSSVGPTIALDGTAPPTPNPNLVWTGVRFLNCATIGTIKTFANFLCQSLTMQTSGNLTFDGTIGTIGIGGQFANPTGTSMIFAPTLTISQYIQIASSTFTITPGNSALNLSAAATVAPNQYLVQSCLFAGGGTYLLGVLPSDNKAAFTGNTGVPNSRAVAAYTMVSNAVVTPIVTLGVFVKVSGVTAASGLAERFTMTSNRATYTNSLPGTFEFTSNATITGANNRVFAIRYALNGTTLANSEMRVTTSGGVRADAVSTQFLISLNSGDFIELFVANLTNTESPTVVNMSMIGVNI